MEIERSSSHVCRCGGVAIVRPSWTGANPGRRFFGCKYYGIASFVNLISSLKSCKQTSDISQIHGFMVKKGIDHDSFAKSKLLASAIQDIKYATSIFNDIQNPNLFMFNTMLRACSVGNDPKQAFVVFNKLRTHGISLDQFSFITVLKACVRELAVKKGQEIHGMVVKSGHLLFIDVKNTLLHFYSICCRIEDVYKLFEEFPEENDLVSWNSLLGANLQASKPAGTARLFMQMVRCGLRVSAATMLNVLSAFADLGDSFGGELIHGYCIKFGFCSNINVCTALIEMYSKTGRINSGRRIFDLVVKKDIIIWNCMIDKYAKLGLLEQAIALLQVMKLQGIKPNSATLAGMLSACATSGSIKLGWYLIDYIEKEGMELDAVLGTALVDMFAKCGFLDKAIGIFDNMKDKDVKSWAAMILGYGVHGRARNAVDLLYRMEEEGFRPNEVTFLGVLSACSHGGLVTEAMKCFEKMVQVYGFSPKIEHYGCIIDLLGRAGLLEEAYDLIKRMPIMSDATAWRALLAACRVYGNVVLGERATRMLVEIGDKHPTDSILLSNIYTSVGRLPDFSRWWETGEERFNIHTVSTSSRERIVKEAGCSTIEIDNHLMKHQLKWQSVLLEG
ncbi:pentatricopeptide repeat-containing protein At1g26900, mitochondrial [Euphorbia lathyris]|uniref:pentatricopeptide repeat-containing protein At1g26900, mitochondrial n=1 Tax=Euphorbia lathyris TaxID=212925 RepID=UPI00331414B6